MTNIIGAIAIITTNYIINAAVVTERVCEYQESTYRVRYEYNTSGASVPLTNPPGVPHYSAAITVLEAVVEFGLVRWVPVCKPFPGQYTVEGCWEDDPVSLVRQAIDRQESHE